MQNEAEDDKRAFEAALASLEVKLREQQWDQAGAAGEALAEASERCRNRGVVLSADDLQRAKAVYERCLLLALHWGEALNQEAQSAGSSQRAFQTYSQS